MASDSTMVAGVIGGIAAVSLAISVTAVSMAGVDRQTLADQAASIAILQGTVPGLVNDGTAVAGSVSLIGTTPVTDAYTILPLLHFKGLEAGTGISVTQAANTNIIANTLEVTLATATPTELMPVSLVATTSAANVPLTRNLVAGAGIALTLSGNDIIISLV